LAWHFGRAVGEFVDILFARGQIPRREATHAN